MNANGPLGVTDPSGEPTMGRGRSWRTAPRSRPVGYRQGVYGMSSRDRSAGFFSELNPSVPDWAQKLAAGVLYSTWKTGLPASMNGDSSEHSSLTA